MVVDQKYIEKTVAGFLGTRFHIAKYLGDWYFAIIEKNGLLLDSRESINDLSVWEFDHYITEISLNDIDDLLQCKMYATYKGNEYEVLDVAPELKTMRLRARRSASTNIVPEDKELGFVYDYCMDIASKEVTPDVIDSIRVKKTSIKSMLSKEIGLWNRLKVLQNEIDNARKSDDASTKQYLDNLYKTVDDVIVKVEMRDLPPSNGSDAGIRKAVAELEDLPNYSALYAAASEVDDFYSSKCQNWD